MLKSEPRLGILGGGQLARMMVLASARLGLEPIVFGKPGDPAAQVCSTVFPGSLSSLQDLRGFFSEVNLVIFENEFIPCDLLEEAARGTDVQFAPGLDAMRFLQDKLSQKNALARLNIPTADYEVRPGSTNSKQDAQSWLEELLTRFPTGAVLKWAQMGYDGKGTFFLSSANDLDRAVLFCNEAELRRLPLYAEARVPFKRELALVACLSASGEFASYPLTISEQLNGVCRRVRGPATGLGVPRRLETRARDCAEKLARELGLTGAFALEFFETRQGKLLVNEIAPRVHNTGHFSLDAAETDQFENHLRAVLGLPLGDTASAPAFIMLNLLGPDKLEGRHHALLPPPPGPRTHLHWYGKKEVTAGRKMGHLNGHAPSPAKLRAVSKEFDDYSERWERSLLKKKGNLK